MLPFARYQCLDEEFDPDPEADYELCRAIVAGKTGIHPDGWGNFDQLTTLPPHFRRHRLPELEVVRSPYAPYYPPPPPMPPGGMLQLTCDSCRQVRFDVTLRYRDDRPAKVAEIRALGHQHGWTCIAGTDRCPRCSQAAAPKAVGNGAGGDQGHEQHP